MNQPLKENCSLVREQYQNIKVGNIMINKYGFFFFLYLLLDLSYFKVSLGMVFLVWGGSELRKTEGPLEMGEYFLSFTSDF